MIAPLDETTDEHRFTQLDTGTLFFRSVPIRVHLWFQASHAFLMQFSLQFQALLVQYGQRLASCPSRIHFFLGRQVMRKIGFLVAGGALLLLSVAFVDGLNAQQKKGTGQPGGFGGGGFGGFNAPGASTLTLLNRAEVKKELDITDEQLEQMPAEVLTAVSKVLNEKQFKRFKQIELQQRGNRAFN